MTPQQLIEELKKSLSNLDSQAKRFVRRAAARALAETLKELEWMHEREYGEWTLASQEIVRVQLEEFIKRTTRNTVAVLMAMDAKAAQRSWADVRRWLAFMDKRAFGAARPVRFDLAEFMSDERNFLINRFERSLALWGRTTSNQMRNLLADQALLGKNWSEAARYLRDNIPKLVHKKLWMLERVAATELANAYNGTTFRALQAMDDDPKRPMYKKLVATFDERTGWDSKILHGQTVPVNQPFINVDGRPYMYPPNRPRDREVVVPWKPEYDLMFKDYDKETRE